MTVDPTNQPIPDSGTLDSARRRFLTILFSDLSDSTRIAATMEAEDYAELLGRLRAIVSRAIARHGGTLVRIDGDGFAAIFGYPVANDDDARRATEAALDIHEEALALQPALRLHSGIHSGLVLLNAGDIVRGRFEMLGDATNVASRLAGAAQAGMIFVSEATLGSDRNFFCAEQLKPLHLKGKIQPVSALRITGRAAPQSRFAARRQRGFAPFVGRREERMQLRDSLVAAMSGAIELALVTGPAGVGKTRLSEDCLATAAALGCAVHRGFCDAYLGAAPLQPFLEILRSIFALTPDMPSDEASQTLRQFLHALELDHHADTCARLMSLVQAQPPADGSGVEAATAAICAVLTAVAARTPLALFIDDWQATDDASRQVLDAIRRPAPVPILILIATRQQDQVDPSMATATVIGLAPLTDGDATATVAALLPIADPFRVARIVEFSGGNPLFIEELCHAELGGNSRGGELSGTAWLDALIVARFTRLPEAQARLARAAAVIGPTIPSWLFERLTGCHITDPQVQALAEADFIYEGHRSGTIAFKHGITRHVIYQLVGLAERRRLHREIADALRQLGGAAGEDEWCEALAHHNIAGGRPAAGADFAIRAGDKAVAISALDRAQQQYRAALEALDELPPSAESDEKWGIVFRRYIRASLFDPSRDQLPVYKRAIARAEARGDAAASAWAEYWLGCFYYPLGEGRLSIAHCERALAGARSLRDERLVGQIEATLSHATTATSDFRRATVLLDSTISDRRRNSSSDRASVSLVYSLGCRAWVLAEQGQFENAYDCFEEAIATIGETFPELRASLVGKQAIAMIWQGRWQEAHQFAAEAEAIGERIKLRYTFAMARAIGSYAQWRIDRQPTAAQMLTEATGWLADSGRNQFISLNHAWLAEIMLDQGNIAGMRRHAAGALWRARQHDRLGEPAVRRVQARHTLTDNTRKSAVYYLACANRAATLRQSRHELAANLLCQGEMALAANDIKSAYRLLAGARVELADMAMITHLHVADQLLAQCESI